MSPLLVPFGADWDEAVTEERAGLTDILVSENGNEQRRARRRHPRVTLEMAFTADNARLAALLQSLALRATDETVAAPAWQYAWELGVAVTGSAVIVDTTYTPWNRWAMLYQEDGVAELVEIDAVGSGELTLVAPVGSPWPRGRTIVPCYEASIDQDPELRWMARNYLRWRARFVYLAQEVARWSGAAGGAAVNMTLGTAPSREAETPVTLRRNLRRFDNPDGELSFASPFVTRTQLDYEAVFLDPASAAELWTWLSGRVGRLNPVWIPTFSEDLPLAANVAPGATTLPITNVDFEALHALDESRRWVALIDGINAYTVRKVASVADAGATETLTLNAAAGITLRRPDAYLSFAHYARLNDDAVRVEWVAPWAGRSRLTFVDLPNEVEDDWDPGTPSGPGEPTEPGEPGEPGEPVGGGGEGGGGGEETEETLDNYPEGFETFELEEFADMQEVNVGGASKQRQFTYWREGGSYTTTPDPDIGVHDLPDSSDGNVAFVRVPEGFNPGGSTSPGTWRTDFDPVPKLYGAIRFQLSEDYINYNGSKIFYLSAGSKSPAFFALIPEGAFTTQGAAISRPTYLRVGLQGVLNGGGGHSWNAEPNQGASTEERRAKARLTRGQWDLIEFLVEMNTLGNTDGILKVWLNGVLAISYNNVGWYGYTHATIQAFDGLTWSPTHASFPSSPGPAAFQWAVYQNFDWCLLAREAA